MFDEFSKSHLCVFFKVLGLREPRVLFVASVHPDNIAPAKKVARQIDLTPTACCYLTFFTCCLAMLYLNSDLRWLPRVFTNTLAIECELEKEA